MLDPALSRMAVAVGCVFSVDHVNSLVSAERMLESGMRWVLHFPEWQLQLAVAETETKSHGIKNMDPTVW